MLDPHIFVRYPFAPCIINEFLYCPCNTLSSVYFKHLFEEAYKYGLNPVDVLIGGGL